MRHLVIVAGTPSHGPGEHEFAAGATILQACLDAAGLDLRTTVAFDGAVPSASDGPIDAIAFYADGGPGHPLADHAARARLAAMADDGVGLAFLHYALEAPAAAGGDEITAWLGGRYEPGRSCNPMWAAAVDVEPGHPVVDGVEPFTMRDEWYIAIDFDRAAAVRPLLTTVPSDAVRAGPYVYPPGPYPHILAASGRQEVLMWANERADGGRSVGMTGGHFHANWAIDPFRRAVLGGLAWIAGLEVPAGGVRSTVAEADLAAAMHASA